MIRFRLREGLGVVRLSETGPTGIALHPFGHASKLKSLITKRYIGTVLSQLFLSENLKNIHPWSCWFTGICGYPDEFPGEFPVLLPGAFRGFPVLLPGGLREFPDEILPDYRHP